MSLTTQNEAPVFNLDPFLNRNEGAAELYLIRHGDAFPDNDDDPLAPGTTYENRPLSKLGWEQARKLAAHFNATKFDAIYSSPLIRCRQTATPLAELQSLSVQIEPDIREVELHRGETPPTDAKAMREQLDQVVRLAAQAGHWEVIPNAETGAAFRQRVVPAIDQIASQHPGERVAIVAHGGTINMYVANLLDMEREFFFPVVNTSVSIVRVKGHSRVLVTLNDTCHLR